MLPKKKKKSGSTPYPNGASAPFMIPSHIYAGNSYSEMRKAFHEIAPGRESGPSTIFHRSCSEAQCQSEQTRCIQLALATRIVLNTD
jgi:hypothetical protein